MSMVFPPFQLDLNSEQVWRDDQPIALRPKTFAVLRYLVEHPNKLVTKDELLDAVWAGTVVSDTVLKSCIRELRTALGDDVQTPQYIATVHRRGYRFIAPLSTSPPPSHKLQVASRKSSPPAPSPQHPAPTLVGREAELQQLSDWLDKALRGERQLVFVTGEAGIGKSMLVDAFLQQLDGQPVWIGRGQCIEQYGAGEPYMPILEALSRLCREPGGEQLIALLQQHAPTWLVQMPTLLDATELEALQRRVQGATRERMLREMAEAIDALTAEQPVVLWLEDLHWSDPSTLELLALLARRREPARLLVLGTYRPVDLIITEHPLRAVKQELQLHGQCEELSLRLLTEAAVGEYLAVRFAISAEARPIASLQRLAHAIHQRTEGNPLFVVNVVNDLILQGVFARTDGQWVLQEDSNEAVVNVPETLRQMIERQLERLGAEEQRVVEVASVAGMEFSAATIVAGTEAAIETVEDQCTRLARRGQFLQAKGAAEWPDGTSASRYGFLHALYQEVTYERVPVGRRARLHQRIAEREEAAYGARAGERAAELAMHFERGGVWKKALEYLVKAGQRSQQAYANQEALAYYDQALAICQRLGETVEPSLLMEIYTSKATVHFMQSEFLFVVECAQHKLKIARQQGEKTKQAEALAGLAFSFFNMHEFEKALDCAEQTKVLASEMGAKIVLARITHMIGLVHEVIGNLEEATRCYEESLQISRQAGDKITEGFSLNWLGLLRNFVGEYEQALQFHEQAVSIGQTHNIQDGLLAFFWTRSIAFAGKGEYEAALGSLKDALELSDRLGDRIFKCRALNTMGWVYGELYNLDRALRHNLEGAELAYPSGDPELIRNAEINAGDDYLLLGDMEQAQHYLEKVYRDSEQRGKWGEEWLKWRYLQRCCHSLGELWLMKGDADKALELAEECLKLAEPTNSRKNIVKGWRLQGQAFCLQGKLEAAVTKLQKALALAQEIGNPPQLWKTYHALGEVYERQGATDLSRAAYANALEVIEGVASQLQDQELKQVFLSARPVQEIRVALSSVAEAVNEMGDSRKKSKHSSNQPEEQRRKR